MLLLKGFIKIFILIFLVNSSLYSNDIINQSQILFDSGKFQESINLINSKKIEIIKEQDKWQADNIEGWSYYKLGKLDDAYNIFELIANNNNHRYHTNSIFMLGKIQEEKGKINEACQNYLKIINNYPKSNQLIESEFRLANVFMQLDDINKNELLKSERKNIANALFLAGDTFQNKKQEYQDAEKFLDYIVRNFQDYEKFDDSIMLLGRAKMKLGKLDESLDVFRSLFKNTSYNNHWNEAQAEIVRILVQQKKWAEVKKEALELYSYPHERGKAYAVLSYVNACLGEEEKDEAIKFLEEIIKTNPDDPYIDYYQVRLLELKGSGCCIK